MERRYAYRAAGTPIDVPSARRIFTEWLKASRNRGQIGGAGRRLLDHLGISLQKINLIHYHGDKIINSPRPTQGP